MFPTLDCCCSKNMFDLLLEPVVEGKSIVGLSLASEVHHEASHLFKVGRVEGRSHSFDWSLIFIFVLIRFHVGDHLEHLLELVHVHFVIHSIHSAVLALHHIERHHFLGHEGLVLLHCVHHLSEVHHHSEFAHLVVHAFVVILVVLVAVIVSHVGPAVVLSSVVMVPSVIVLVVDDTHHPIELLKLVRLHVLGKAEHSVDKAVNRSVWGKVQL